MASGGAAEGSGGAVSVAVVGSIVTGFTIFTPRVPGRGENVLADRFEIGPGGKGANAAVACARLGARALLVGRVGCDEFGRDQLVALRAEGVGVDGVTDDPEASTGVAFILVDAEGENTILVVNGANDRLTPDMVEAGLAPHWSSLQAVIVDFEVPPEAVTAAVNSASERGIPVIVDAGPPRPYPPGVWGRAAIISPNEIEAAALIGRPVETSAAAEAAARVLMAAGPGAVVMKRGASGALAVSQDGVWDVPAFRVNAVDTTGAGDAFTGALAVAVAKGSPLPEAVRFACAAGGLATTRRGTMLSLPTLAEVEALMA